MTDAPSELPRFPTTSEPVWGCADPGEDVTAWRTRLRFGTDRPVEQEVVPQHDERRATLRIDGAEGPYELDFPGGRRTLAHPGGEHEWAVGELVRTGKHRYRLEGPPETTFTASVHVAVDRPLVDVADEGFVSDWETMTDGQRQQTPTDQGADRVGRWSCWSTASPAAVEGTVLGSERTIDTWRYRSPLRAYAADLGRVGFDDDGWTPVEVPHELPPGDRDEAGFAWYRTRVDVPADWDDERVVLRFEGVDDDATVYVNGHEAGYHRGPDDPFQLDVTGYLRPGDGNVIAVRVRPREGPGGIHGRVALATVDRFGVRLRGRLYPHDETALTISVHERDGTPVGFGEASTLRYAPPQIELADLGPAGDRTTLRTAADPGVDRLYYDLSADGERTVRVAVDPADLSGSIDDVVALEDGIRIDVDGRQVFLELPGCEGWQAVERWSDTGGFDGSTEATPDERFDVVFATVGDATLVAGSEPASAEVPTFAAVRTAWEPAVYGIARPVDMDDEQAAAWRAYKQTVLFNARHVDDDAYHGLLADFDKPIFEVYWMRDCFMSVPGALYTGHDARTAAVENVSATFDRYAEHKEIAGLYPDGRVREGRGYSDGPALGIHALAYAWALEGDDWLAAHAVSAEEMVEYLVGLDEGKGDRADGLIRSSKGDWKDVGTVGGIHRSGAVLFVNALYLRALRLGASIAEALRNDERAERWQARYDEGVDTLNRAVEAGGLWLPDDGHYAESVQRLDDDPWTYPDELSEVTVFPAFATVAHAIALIEGIVPDARIEDVVDAAGETGVAAPVPAASHVPFYDVFEHAGLDPAVPEDLEASDLWIVEQRRDPTPPFTPEMFLPWKGWPGNHGWGGRWPMAGGWLSLALWENGEPGAAAEVRAGLERALRRVSHPGRCVETESYGAVTREETGCRFDPAGYYQLWSAAMPLQAIVEGSYGARPVPGGARLDLRRCEPGAGLVDLPIAGGALSFSRPAAGRYEIDLETDVAGELVVDVPWAEATVRGIAADRTEGADGRIVVRYDGDERIVCEPA